MTIIVHMDGWVEVNEPGLSGKEFHSNHGNWMPDGFYILGNN
jgi:hypothetical protein